MELQKIAVKVFAADPNVVPLPHFIDIFHRWIQASDGAYHDVADYSHMQSGPGIVLVASEANVAIDETGHRRGLLYSQKCNLSGSNVEKLTRVVRSALANCCRLEEEPTLQGKLKFSGQPIVITVNDRLVTNTGEVFEQIMPEIDFLARHLYGSTDFITIHNQEDPRHRLSVTLTTPLALETRTLLHNLQTI